MEGLPKRGDAISFWLELRARAAEEEGAVLSASSVRKLLSEYHYCADNFQPLPVSIAEVYLLLGRTHDASNS